MNANSDSSATRQSLIEKVSKLDPAAWDEFFRIYEPLLRGYIADCNRRYTLGIRDDDREDVKQTVLLSLLRSMPSFRLDHEGKGRFRTWLWRVTHNATIDWVRKHRRRHKPGKAEAEADSTAVPAAAAPMREVLSTELDGLVCDDAPEPDAQVIEESLWEVRRKILEQVKEEMQSAKKWLCFELHFLNRRPSAEVAAELGLSVSAVNTYTSRVLARIRELCAYYDVER
jgi:RNA polymerase sigma-70 factor (ECF subfamily)